MFAPAQTLVTMRERLAGLLNRRSAREEETDEKLKETASALQAAYRERQVPPSSPLCLRRCMCEDFSSSDPPYILVRYELTLPS